MVQSNEILLYTPQHWEEYALIDSGDREKLERFGRYVLIRPEPQAVWRKALSDKEWASMAHARYHRTKGVNQVAGEAERGTWQRNPGMPEQWTITYRYSGMNLTFRLGLTAFGHIGVFPEQASNWDFIYDSLRKSNILTPRILNLFAYTGGASVAARAAGAEVVHVDSVKPVITWAREVMEASGLNNIRWVVEDALSFVKREVKRGNRYHGIILDPPAYGRGPDGEKWVLGDSIDELIAQCSKLLTDEHRLFVFSLYSMGFSPLIGENLVRNHLGQVESMESGELFIPDQAGRRLPLGTFVRFGG